MLQLADFQKSSAVQTAALIDQENTAETLSKELAYTKDALQDAQHAIVELKASVEALPPAASAALAQTCADSTDATMEKACEREFLEFKDIKTELKKIDGQLGALENENDALRSSRCSLRHLTG